MWILDGKVNLKKNAVKALFAISLPFAGLLLCPINSSAEYCMWPTMTVVWSVVSGNYTDGSKGIGYDITRDCPSDCCRDVTFLNRKIIVDNGDEIVGDSYTQPLTEGPHNAIAEFTANGGGENVSRTVSFAFTVDKTPPAISFTKPENNISIPITDVSVAGSVSDAGAKLNMVEVNLVVSSGPCRFHKDFSGSTVNLAGISRKYCDAAYLAAAPTLCGANMGAEITSFPLDYDLRDYVDFPEGQDCSFVLSVGAVDRVGNGSLGSDGTVFNSKSLFFSVDQAPPVLTMKEPEVIGADMYWGNSGEPVISGLAKDLSEITKVWLTIKDERTNKSWDGTKWQEKAAIVNAEKAGTTTVTWRYYGLTRDAVESGVFAITTYARDKFNHVGSSAVSGKNKKRIDLHNTDFTSLSMSVQDVSNIGANAVNPHSFTSNSSENTISVSATISPARLAGELNNFVQWNIVGENGDSGNPNKPYNGNPSLFLVEPPTMPTKIAGRSSPMAYAVKTGIKYDFEGEPREYSSPIYGNIAQDNLDTLRQEYIDLSTGYKLPRGSFDQDLPVFPDLLASPGSEPAKHEWHILRFLNIKAMILDNTLGPLGLALNPSSGYRCPIGNKATPGSEYNSNHMLGRAMDYSQGNPAANWQVWVVSRNNGAIEHLLYDQNNCRVISEDIPVSEFSLPKIMRVKCPKKDVFSKRVISYSHGHAAW